MNYKSVMRPEKRKKNNKYRSHLSSRAAQNAQRKKNQCFKITDISTIYTGSFAFENSWNINKKMHLSKVI